jgi:transposase
MNPNEVFALALGLEGTPWYVADIRFDQEQRRLDIDLDFPPASRFPHPDTGQLCALYDTEQEPSRWRHLNFFQFECYVDAFVPRVDGGSGAGVKQVRVPWARPRSGFTLLMESLMVLLAQTGMTVAEVARTVGEYAQRLWNVLEPHVDQAHGQMDLSQVRVVSVDEVAKRRGHDYLTVVSEPGQDGARARVLFVTEGKDAGTVVQAGQFLTERGVPPAQIQTVCTDMSGAYRRGLEQTFPQATLVFDYFHVIQMATGAVDAVRRREREKFPELLKGKRWLFLKGEDQLSEAEKAERARLCRGQLQTGKAWNHVDALRDIMKQKEVAAAEQDLKWWCGWVGRSRIPEMKKVAQSVRHHWDGIVAYLKTRVTNGAAEALNGIIQTVKRKSRGFRTFRYFRIMIYLVASRLKFDLPQPVPTTHTNSY